MPVFISGSRQGSGAVQHPRGHQLEPGFVPVPGTAFCAERRDCHGEEHQGRVGRLRPTLVTSLAAVMTMAVPTEGLGKCPQLWQRENEEMGLPLTSPHARGTHFPPGGKSPNPSILLWPNWQIWLIPGRMGAAKAAGIALPTLPKNREELAQTLRNLTSAPRESQNSLGWKGP